MAVPDEAKAHILRLIPLGVDIFTACVQAHLTFDQMDELESDEDFARELQYSTTAEEVRLLEKYKETVDKAARIKLDPNAIAKRLSILFPEKYSQQALNNRAEEGRKGGSSRGSSVESYIRIPDNGRGGSPDGN